MNDGKRPTLVQVDAFTSTPFSGNPAAVCLLNAAAESAWMQRVAAEMNLSETAFLWPRADQFEDSEASDFELKWFTPTAEVNLCGHATLSAAHALWQGGHVARDRCLRFHSRSGLLEAYPEASGAIRLDFPALPSEPAALHPLIAAAIQAPVSDARRAEGGRWIVRLATEDAVRSLVPDLAGLRVPHGPTFAVTAAAKGDEFDIVSRYFAPSIGVDEDPVTGSIHCALAPYWADQLNRNTLRASQASARGGELLLRLEANNRVHLLGAAVTVSVGELYV